MNEHDHTQLSEAGRARRAEILERAAGELIVTHRRRRRRRTITAACAWCIIIAGSAVTAIIVGADLFGAPRDNTTIADAESDVDINSHTREEAAETHSSAAERAEHTARATSVRIVRIETDADAAERNAVHTPVRVDRIDDRTLVALLASIDRPAGLMYIDGEARLTRDVTDDPSSF